MLRTKVTYGSIFAPHGDVLANSINFTLQREFLQNHARGA